MSVVVVTGASSGMGRACVDAVRGLYDSVVAVDLSAPDIDGCIGIASDVSDVQSVSELAARARELGEFRALIHAAGISPTMGEPRRILAVDLVGTQLVLDSFAPLAQAGSAAVCFGSTAAHYIAGLASADIDALIDCPLADDFLDRASAMFPDRSLAYSVAKRGVLRASERAAIVWAARGGRVVSLSPGIIDTPMGQREYEQQPAMKEMIDRAPLRRFGRAEEVAAVAVFLISDAASFVTGVDVRVDGGEVAAAFAARPGVPIELD